ncbi:hypothetical protein ABPG75_012333 [Micractinium tetrahymenae]
MASALASEASRLVGQLRRHTRSGDLAAAESRCFDLAELCRGRAVASRQVLAAGGMKALAEYMAAAVVHWQDGPACTRPEEAALAMSLLVQCQGEEARRAALACGAMPALISMLTCGGSPQPACRTQGAAALALSFLTDHNEECSREVLSASGSAISWLVQLLSISSDHDMLEAAMCTLNNLVVCGGEEAAGLFADAGGLSALSRSLSLPPSMQTTTMLLSACSAATQLAFESGPRVESLAASGAVSSLARLLRHHDADVAARAANALCNLAADSPERSAAILKAGAVPPLLHLLRQPPGSPAVMAAVLALQNVAANLEEAC